MTAPTANCLIDSTLKDHTDQSLVPKADAEHMYARLDRIPDTRTHSAREPFEE